MKLIYRIVFLLLLLFSTIIFKHELKLAYFILGAVVAYSLLLILRKNPEGVMYYKKSMILTVDLFALMLLAPYLILSALMNSAEYQFNDLFISILGGMGVFLLIKAAWFDSLNVGFNEEGIIFKSIFKKRIVNFRDIKKAQIVAQKHSTFSKFILRTSGVANPAFIKHSFEETKNVIPAVKISLSNNKSFYFNIQTNNTSQLDFIDVLEKELIKHDVQISEEVIVENIKYYDAEFSTTPRKNILTLLISFFVFFILTIVVLIGNLSYESYKHPPVKYKSFNMQAYERYKKISYSNNIVDKSVTNFDFPNIKYEINLANDNECADIVVNNSIYVLLSQSSATQPNKFTIVKFDINGKVLMQKQVGSGYNDYSGKLKILDSNNILLTGISYTGRSAESRGVVFIHKLDKNLNTIWKKTINRFPKYCFNEIFDVDYKNDDKIDLLLKTDYSPTGNFGIINPEETFKNAILMQIGRSNKIAVLDSNRYYQDIQFNNNVITGVLNREKFFEVNNFNNSGKIIKQTNMLKDNTDFIYQMLIGDDENIVFTGCNKTPSFQKSILLMNMQKQGNINIKYLIGMSNVMGTCIIKTTNGYAILANPLAKSENSKENIYFNITQTDNSFNETYTKNFIKSDNEVAGLKIVSLNNSLYMLGDKYFMKDGKYYIYKTLINVKLK